jgi:RNA polymerase sigma-70 factor (ECF subfamily)
MPHALSKAQQLDLAQQIRTGDTAAFDVVYKTFHAALWRFAYYYVESREVAEDIVQDVFVGLWERRTALVIQGGLDVYLYTAVKHRALELLRHERTKRRIIHTEGNTRVSGIAQDQQEGRQRSDEINDIIQHILLAMTPRRREILTMRWIDGFKHEEIANILGMSLSAVKMQVKRGYEQLKPLLEAYLRD